MTSIFMKPMTDYRFRGILLKTPEKKVLIIDKLFKIEETDEYVIILCNNKEYELHKSSLIAIEFLYE